MTANQRRGLTCVGLPYSWHYSLQLLVWELIYFDFLVVSSWNGDADPVARPGWRFGCGATRGHLGVLLLDA